MVTRKGAIQTQPYSIAKAFETVPHSCCMHSVLQMLQSGPSEAKYELHSILLLPKLNLCTPQF